MWKCPICGRENQEGWVCTSCGFDESRNYIRYRSLVELPKEVCLSGGYDSQKNSWEQEHLKQEEEKQAQEARRKQEQEKQAEEAKRKQEEEKQAQEAKRKQEEEKQAQEARKKQEEEKAKEEEKRRAAEEQRRQEEKEKEEERLRQEAEKIVTAEKKKQEENAGKKPKKGGGLIFLLLLAALGGGGFYAYNTGMIPGLKKAAPAIESTAAGTRSGETSPAEAQGAVSRTNVEETPETAAPAENQTEPVPSAENRTEPVTQAENPAEPATQAAVPAETTTQPTAEAEATTQAATEAQTTAALQPETTTQAAASAAVQENGAPAGTGTGIQAGDVISFGAYEQDNNSSNGKEDIEWHVLAVNGGSALLLSRYTLDCLPFHHSKAEISWDESSLRTWLNESFLAEAFDESEQRIIMETALAADANPVFTTDPGGDTTDRIFLLGISDVYTYYIEDGGWASEPTAYAEAKGVFKNGRGYCWWWLRSPGGIDGYAADISTEGSVHTYGFDVISGAGGVRPALWIDTELVP